MQHLVSEACKKYWPKTQQIFGAKSRLLATALLDLNLITLDVNEFENQKLYLLILVWSCPACQ